MVKKSQKLVNIVCERPPDSKCYLHLCFFFRHVVLVGSDNIILGDSVILSDDSPNTLPVKDLTTTTVRIKLDQKKANKERSPLKKLQEKFTKQEDSTEEWFKISDISFHTGLLKTLKVWLTMIFSVKNGLGFRRGVSRDKG